MIKPQSRTTSRRSHRHGDLGFYNIEDLFAELGLNKPKVLGKGPDEYTHVWGEKDSLIVYIMFSHKAIDLEIISKIDGIDGLNQLILFSRKTIFSSPDELTSEDFMSVKGEIRGFMSKAKLSLDVTNHFFDVAVAVLRKANYRNVKTAENIDLSSGTVDKIELITKKIRATKGKNTVVVEFNFGLSVTPFISIKGPASTSKGVKSVSDMKRFLTKMFKEEPTPPRAPRKPTKKKRVKKVPKNAKKVGFLKKWLGL
jgi:hypothetical protein